MAYRKQIDSLTKGLRSAKAEKRDIAAAELTDYLEADQIRGSALQAVVQALTKAALAETDPVAKESMFNGLSSVGWSGAACPVEWDSIASALDQLDTACLEHALVLLGASGEMRYRARIEKHLDHSDETIRLTAAEALAELEARNRQTVCNQ